MAKDNSAIDPAAGKSWGLDPENHNQLDEALCKSPIRIAPLRSAQILSDGQIVKAIWYLHDREKPRVKTSWVLGVDDSCLALTLALKFASIVDAANHLMNVGSCFFTLARIAPPLTPSGPQSPFGEAVELLGSRPPDYKYGAADYEFYVKERWALLQQHKLRSCLSRGGILWRLAVEDLAPGIVLEGTSDIAKAQYLAFAVTSQTGEVFVDDELGPYMTEFLCETYRHCTGVRNKTDPDNPQLALRSWWPRPETWDTGDFAHSWWTPGAEMWYLSTMKRFKAGELQPQTNTEWKYLVY